MQQPQHLIMNHSITSHNTRLLFIDLTIIPRRKTSSCLSDDHSIGRPIIQIDTRRSDDSIYLSLNQVVKLPRCLRSDVVHYFITDTIKPIHHSFSEKILTSFMSNICLIKHRRRNTTSDTITKTSLPMNSIFLPG